LRLFPWCLNGWSMKLIKVKLNIPWFGMVELYLHPSLQYVQWRGSKCLILNQESSPIVCMSVKLGLTQWEEHETNAFKLEVGENTLLTKSWP
jgi:hypothetical protein